MTNEGYFRSFVSQTDAHTLFKMDHYLDVYDRILAGWQGRQVSFLEIGVYRGGSLRNADFAKRSSIAAAPGGILIDVI
jgi:hypothetical protein